MTLERRVFIDHLTLVVADFERSLAFYEAALEPLGVNVIDLGPAGVSIGPEDAEDLGLRRADDAAGQPQSGPAHVAFLAANREQVDQFHAAALAAGGTDNGAPGLRPQYHAGYYGAYVLDPDGNNVEAVFHDAG